ncbi:MAG TPA: NUDIX domain-containing protein [Candidatus Paceibacterota bacterium]
MAKVFGCSVSKEEAERQAYEMYTEHFIFSQGGSLEELEEFATETVVGIGLLKINRVIGYVMVENEKRTGYGFPGGTVRPGEKPPRSLQREIREETSLEGIVLDPDNPVSSHEVGENGYMFTAYAVSFGGEPQVPKYSKEEPIINIHIIKEDVLRKLCISGKALKLADGQIGKGILLSHRKVFLEYMRIKDSEKLQLKLRPKNSPKKRGGVQNV